MPQTVSPILESFIDKEKKEEKKYPECDGGIAAEGGPWHPAPRLGSAPQEGNFRKAAS